MGFALPRRLPAMRWAFTPPFHLFQQMLVVIFCCTFLRVASTGISPALCSLKARTFLTAITTIALRPSGKRNLLYMLCSCSSINFNFFVNFTSKAPKIIYNGLTFFLIVLYLNVATSYS